MIEYDKNFNTSLFVTISNCLSGCVRDLCPLAPNNVNTMAAAALAAHNLGLTKHKDVLWQIQGKRQLFSVLSCPSCHEQGKIFLKMPMYFWFIESSLAFLNWLIQPSLFRYSGFCILVWGKQDSGAVTEVDKGHWPRHSHLQCRLLVYVLTPLPHSSGYIKLNKDQFLNSLQYQLY